jgi:hypothetical protein
MKTFEKQFPSLKGHLSPMNRGDILGVTQTFVCVEFIEEYCLDKQRVREAIEKVLEHIEPSSPHIRKIELLKELGL